MSGIHLKHRKGTSECSTVPLPLPQLVRIPMLQHIGQEAIPLVSVGEKVCVGQKIGDSTAPMGLPIHSSVSGTVKSIAEQLTVGGKYVKAVVIETDGAQTPFPGLTPPQGTSLDEFIAAVRESGLSGLGGAGFPTYQKLRHKGGAPIDTLIINGAECEPYITSDYRECMEHPQDIADGIKLIMSRLSLAKAIIGLEDNKPQAIALLSKVTDSLDGVSVMSLKSRYPQGAEKVLIYSVTGKMMAEGQLPADCGVLVLNISTVSALARYFKTGMPLVSRRITVDGDAVTQPKNLEVPLGASVREVLAFCGCHAEECGKILTGGPMMGISLPDSEQPIIKNNNAVLTFRKAASSYDRETACIRCGKCTRVCPLHLMPTELERAYDRRDVDALRRLKVNLCINCGCCSYICPAKRELAAKNQLAKALLRAKKG